MKLFFRLEEEYPWTKKVFGSVDSRISIGNVEPFAPAFWENMTNLIPISSGQKLSFDAFPLDWHRVDFVIDPTQIFHGTGDFPSQIIELHFRNTTLINLAPLVYNPAFTGFLDPYQKINAYRLGFIPVFVASKFEGDFCLALYRTFVILDNWKNSTNCHLLILPHIDEYPLDILSARVRPIDETLPVTVDVEYRSIEHNLAY
jgi:hypothetical protein